MRDNAHGVDLRVVRLTVAALLLIGSSLESAFALPNNENGVTGTEKCECHSGTGTCTLTHAPHGSVCEKNSGDTCSGDCLYSSSTSGITGGVKPVVPPLGTEKMP
jgi:hypothetical protein